VESEQTPEEFLSGLRQVDGVTGGNLQAYGRSLTFTVDVEFTDADAAKSIHSKVMRLFTSSDDFSVTGIETVLTDIFR